MAAIRFHCTHCEQPLEIAEEAAGLAVKCPRCQTELRVPAGMAAAVSATASAPLPATGSSSICAICLSPVSQGEAKAACPDCSAAYHAECWEENRGCAVYGCSQVPEVEQRQAIEIPMSYWGQENKPCPACGREILAAAVRCRHCGATFASARPQEANEFQQRVALEERLPAVRRTVIWLFVFCLLPLLAPAGAVWGLIWYPAHRDEVRALPALYLALCKIGLGVAIGQTVMLVIMGLLFASVRQL
jgi:phage FluMu protein Com